MEESLKVIACANLNHEMKLDVPCQFLCISPVLKDYIDNPSETESIKGITRNGPGTLSFNNEADVIREMLKYLTHTYGDSEVEFVVQPSERGAVFLIQLYKLAWCLALKDLCTRTLHVIRLQIRTCDDFLQAALEAHRSGLIEEEKFRQWFTGYIEEKHSPLLKRFGNEDESSGEKSDEKEDKMTDELRLCSVLVSALAHAKNDHGQCRASAPFSFPVTPQSSSSGSQQESIPEGRSKRSFNFPTPSEARRGTSKLKISYPNDTSTNIFRAQGNGGPTPSPLNRKHASNSGVKKRRVRTYQAYVEDAVEESLRCKKR